MIDNKNNSCEKNDYPNKRLITTPYFAQSALRLVRHDYLQGISDMYEHAHDYYTISLVLKGQLLEEGNEHKYSAKACSLLIKPPGASHSNTFTEDCSLLSLQVYDWEYYQLPFQELLQLSDPGGYPFFIKMLRMKDKKRALAELSNYLKDLYLNRADRRPPAWVLLLKAKLDQYYTEDLQIKDLAKDIGKHPVHVARTFKAYFGIDIKKYLQQLRLHHASTKIIEGQQSLTRITYETGFYDQSHFSRSFKKSTSITPKVAVKLFS